MWLGSGNWRLLHGWQIGKLSYEVFGWIFPLIVYTWNDIFFLLWLQKDIDKYQETFRGTGIGPKSLEKGSEVVVADPKSQKYLAVKLGSPMIVDKTYQVFSTGNPGVYVRVIEKKNNWLALPLDPVTPLNSKPGTAMATLGQYIQYDGKSSAQKVYHQHLYDTCMLRRKDTAVCFSLFFIIVTIIV